MQLHLLKGYHVAAVIVHELELLHFEVTRAELVGADPEVLGLVVHQDQLVAAEGQGVVGVGAASAGSLELGEDAAGGVQVGEEDCVVGLGVAVQFWTKASADSAVLEFDQQEKRACVVDDVVAEAFVELVILEQQPCLCDWSFLAV